MSDMTTFTVRELDREPARILDLCDAEGAVRVRRRDGRLYTIRRDPSSPAPGSWSKSIAHRRKRLKEIFPKPIPIKQVREVDRMIAGE
jgi:hypothetical protein